MKKIFFQLCFYVTLTVLGMILLSICAHINFLKTAVYIYYYRMLYYAVIATLILLFLFFVLHGICGKILKIEKLPDFFQPGVIISGVIISALFMAFFITAGPMPIDRSYSIFSIADMYESPDKVYSSEEIEQAFMEKYIQRNGATRRRIEEQKSIGNIEEIDGGYRITNKGKRLIEMMRFVESLYPADEKRTIYPE